MKRPLIGILLAVLFSQPAFPLVPPPEIKSILDDVDAREYAAAVDKLSVLERSAPKAFAAGDINYLLGRMAEADGQLALALAEYGQAADRDPALKPYALAHLSHIARWTGNLMLERLYLLELTAPTNRGLLSAAATRRLGRNYFEMGNYAEAIRVVNRVSSDAGAVRDARGRARADEERRENLLLLGEAQLRSGLVTDALQTFGGLTAAVKDISQPDDIAARACLFLDELDGGAALNEEEHLRRARIYQADRKFLQAKKHFEKVVAGNPNGPFAADAVYQIGRGLAQQNQFADAIGYFNRVIEKYPEQPSAKDAILQSASSQARLGNADESVKRYQRFIDTYPADEKLDRAYLNIVDVLRDKGADDDALGWCAKTRAAFAGKLPANLATFTEARIYIAREDWQRAIDRLNTLPTAGSLGGAAVPGGTTLPEVNFLKGYCLEQLGRYPEALEIYLSIPDGRDSYYGGRASERIAGLARSDGSAPAVRQEADMYAARLQSSEARDRLHAAQALLRLSNDEETVNDAKTVLRSAVAELQDYRAVPGTAPPPSAAGPAKQPHVLVANTLLALGLYDEAAPELEAAGKDPCEVAAAYQHGDRGDKAIEFIEPAWRKMPADYPIELIPHGQLQLLYPAPYADLVRRYAAERGIDPRFLLAVMRQESGFDPDARSGAAAAGLMQFISSTADKIAIELGRSELEPDDLFQPSTSILLGSQYLADLFKLFPDKPEAVAAAYNGGEDNVARWLARSRTDQPDRYVPEIMYAQSKDYVYRVMANYRMYRFIYDRDLHPADRSAEVKINAPCTRPAGG